MPRQVQAPLRDNGPGRQPDPDNPWEQCLIETAPGETQWVTQNQKWIMRRSGYTFMDITHTQDLGSIIRANQSRQPVKFPSDVALNESVHPMLPVLDKDNMEANLKVFTSFRTRYYKSSYGVESSNWLLGRVKDVVEGSGATEYGATVEHFKHPWGQHSVIATIPGQSEKTVVIGAHQDSINLFIPSLLAAPGADDDGSGTVTILEALRVLLSNDTVKAGNATNTLEFHWYSAEEGGLLGSQAIFSAYEKEGRDVVAMLQQDMTGYVEGTLAAGKPESVGVITDYVDQGLTTFIKKVIDAYCEIPYVETKCGYACSDHASASKAGYPSAFVIESAFEDSDQKIHTVEDKIEFLSFDHMLQHARLTLGLAMELTFADFE
ncbi:hypothetical protein BDY21DRAFT_290109 [Lineolata rhizophorae]|uniref:Peptide hydrolase n=1 Tax=Lineolata rhizophorae TaxID=578093 RepID=A0A6A6NT71_9PEZI|nr:hypothetical protein BDY21DRAFT_290109 [Lineolata rhizophorae]